MKEDGKIKGSPGVDLHKPGLKGLVQEKTC